MALFGRETEQDKARADAWASWLRSQNPLAIVSLVLGVFSLIEFGALIIFGVAGIACGVIALRQLAKASCDEPRRNGRGLAWWGIGTSAVSLLIAMWLYLRHLG